MRTNQFADLLTHVELEWLTDRSGLSVEESEGSGVLTEVLLSYKILMCFVFFQSESGGFCDFYVQIPMTIMNAK